MVPSDLANYFLASVGAGAALVGLLFVAISIAPERTVMPGASAERQAVAANAFGALLNPFFISLFALNPRNNLGQVVLVMGLIGVANSLILGWVLLKHSAGWFSASRRMVLILGSLVLYGYELWDGVQLLQSPPVTSVFYSLTTLLNVVYALGLLRAWQLLGGRQYLLAAWLNPLRDDKERQAMTNSDQSRTTDKIKQDDLK